MADNPQDKTQAQQPASQADALKVADTKHAALPTEDEQREADLKTIMTPEQLSAKRRGETEGDVVDKAKPAEDDKKAGDDKVDDKAKTAAEAEKKGGDDKAKEGEEKLPSWLEARTKRVADKERKVDDRESAEKQRIRDLEEENEQLRAKAAAKPAAEDKAPVRPKASDFDDVDTYEEARDEYDTAKAAWDKKAATAAKEPEKKAAPASKAPPLALGMTDKEFTGYLDTVNKAIGDDLAADISDSKKVPRLTEVMIAQMAHTPEEDAKDMARFVIDNPKTMKAIADLAPMAQAGALERAFLERTKPKLKSDAPKETKRINASEAGNGGFNYKDFEKQRNAQEIEERYN